MAANAHALIDYLHGQGKLVVWVGPPLKLDSETWERRFETVVLAAVASIAAWVFFDRR